MSMPAETHQMPAGWIPAARIAVVVAGIACFLAIVYVQTNKVAGSVYWLFGLGLALYGTVAAYRRLGQRARGEATGTVAELLRAERDHPRPPLRPLQGDEPSTPATFRPERLWGPQKLSAPALMLILLGVAATVTGIGGAIVGIPLIVLGFFVTPSYVPGIWYGDCPHCGEPTSSFRAATEFPCTQCERPIVRQGDRYYAARSAGESVEQR